jgi:hypothetical protein
MTHLVAELCSAVWQKRNRSSFRPLAKPYLPDIFGCFVDGLVEGKLVAQLVVDVSNPRQAGSGLSWSRSDEADENGA